MPKKGRKKTRTQVGKSIEYFDPKAPGSYAGASTFQRHHPKYKLENLYNVLSKYRSYTLHRGARRRFPRNRTITGGIDSLWDIDLADMKAYEHDNDGYRYLLIAIDVFSKKAWGLPTKRKDGPTLVKTWEKLFEITERRPESVRSDKGGEFKNHSMNTFFKQHNINYYTSQNENTKANFVERFLRTLKGKMWRYFTYHGSYRWVDVIQDLITSYNNTYHRSIKMTPNEVNQSNEVEVFRRLYDTPFPRKLKFKFKVGDTVRISANRMIFDKAYEPNWTEEVYTVSECLTRHPPVYRIKDLSGEQLEGTFYDHELQKVDISDNIFTIEKVIQTRTRRGRKEYFVKWRGYPSSFNSWTTSKPFEIK